ncbi:MAG: ATP-dependent helicase [Cyanobacteria bacterium NC_groundwater_1444_Ag_S-0.65um_54_12]|nr:ATP-dependent helicase [Cyanobacteria bacterium NC_groundwater_1444_Ag_S-0.65um_54_12]
MKSIGVPRPLELRPSQEQILAYRSGRLAVAASPGSGKTFILTQLAAHLILVEGIPPEQLLILTYMRSAAHHFRTRLQAVLGQRGHSARGLRISTIHAFCQGILRQEGSRYAIDNELPEVAETERYESVIVSEPEQLAVLHAALAAYKSDPARRAQLYQRLEDRDVAEFEREILRDALGILSCAKHAGIALDTIAERLPDFPELGFLAAHYAEQQRTNRTMDFADLLYGALSLLEEQPALLAYYRQQIRYILEDEAQDSTPTQQRLLELLAGSAGNWVRVGDANQAIMGSFTANDARFFRAFCLANPVIPMNETSRNGQIVIDLANRLVELAEQHQDCEIRNTFNGLRIAAATAGPRNPDPASCAISWTEHYSTKQEETEGVLLAVRRHLQQQPRDVCAILCFSNHQINGDRQKSFRPLAQCLGLELFTPEDASLPMVPVLTLLEKTLAFLEHPDKAAVALLPLANALAVAKGRRELPSQTLEAALQDWNSHELLAPAYQLRPCRPPTVSEADYAWLVKVAESIEHLLPMRKLPLEDLLLACLSELLGQTPDTLSLVERLAVCTRKRLWYIRPSAATARSSSTWSLVEIRRTIKELLATDRVYHFGKAAGEVRSPRPGQVVITTIHGAKGAEYDAVWLPGIGYYYLRESYFPWELHEVKRPSVNYLLARRLLLGQDGDHKSALLAQQREIIQERLRLLYVGITRAKRHLALSCHYPGRGPVAPAHIQELAYSCRN